MTRFLVITGIAAISFSAMVVAAATALMAGDAQGMAVAPSSEQTAEYRDSNSSWPPPEAPFDETPITPVESAGAPMFPAP